MDVNTLFMCYQYTRNESNPASCPRHKEREDFLSKLLFSIDMELEKRIILLYLHQPDNFPVCKFSPLSTSSLNLSCLTIICWSSSTIHLVVTYENINILSLSQGPCLKTKLYNERLFSSYRSSRNAFASAICPTVKSEQLNALSWSWWIKVNTIWSTFKSQESLPGIPLSLCPVLARLYHGIGALFLWPRL